MPHPKPKSEHLFERELREIVECVVCKRPFGECGALTFYRVHVEHFVVDPAAVRRQSALGVMLGSAELALVMGQEQPMATLAVRESATLCQDCAVERQLCVAELVELAESE